MKNFKKYFKESSYQGKALSPDNWYHSDKVGDSFVDSPDVRERIYIAKQGYGLDKLINDSSPLVRAEVARHHYKVQEMIHDSSPLVRKALAEEGLCLQRLIHDSNDEVRSIALSKIRG